MRFLILILFLIVQHFNCCCGDEGDRCVTSVDCCFPFGCVEAEGVRTCEYVMRAS